MPVSFGRWLSSSVNASNPPAEAPMPTIGHGPAAAYSPAADPLKGIGDSGFLADRVPFLPVGAAGRLRSDVCGMRGGRKALRGESLPVFFFATHHLCLPRISFARIAACVVPVLRLYLCRRQPRLRHPLTRLNCNATGSSPAETSRMKRVQI